MPKTFLASPDCNLKTGWIEQVRRQSNENRNEVEDEWPILGVDGLFHGLCGDFIAVGVSSNRVSDADEPQAGGGASGDDQRGHGQLAVLDAQCRERARHGRWSAR